MNIDRIHKLQVALSLATVAFGAYLHLQKHKEKKSNEKQSHKRKYELGRAGSSSSDDNEQYKRRRKFSPCSNIKVEDESNDECTETQNISSSRVQISGSGFVDSLVAKFSEEQFKDAFRISRSTADQLSTRFETSPEYKNIFKINNETRIPAKHYIWMFLWFVGRKCSYLELAKMFNVPLCKSVCVVDTVLHFFNNCARDFIRFPETDSELRASADSFEQISGFPEVVACLISTEIQLKASKASYLAQVLCDSKGRFLNVFVDSKSKLHPADVLEKSQINEKVKNICQGRYHVLARSDYFLREWLLSPIDEPSADEQVRYNEKHLATVNVVSDSLNLLTQRFQQLHNMHFFSPYKIKRMFIACCVLENICLEQEDFFDSEEDPLQKRCLVNKLDTSLLRKEPIDDDTHLRKMGELKRKQIIAKLTD